MYPPVNLLPDEQRVLSRLHFERLNSEERNRCWEAYGKLLEYSNPVRAYLCFELSCSHFAKPVGEFPRKGGIESQTSGLRNESISPWTFSLRRFSRDLWTDEAALSENREAN